MHAQSLLFKKKKLIVQMSSNKKNKIEFIIHEHKEPLYSVTSASFPATLT